MKTFAVMFAIFWFLTIQPVWGGDRIAGDTLPIRNFEPLSKNRKPTLSEKRDGRMGKYKFSTVVDNPAIPTQVNSRALPPTCTVVFVAGNPFIPSQCDPADAETWLCEREYWAEQARITYGSKAYIFNSALSVKGIAEVLGRFPKGSVNLLVIGGHSAPINQGRGIFMGYNASIAERRRLSDYMLPLGCENINLESLNYEKNSKNLAVIRGALTSDAWVQLQACNIADPGVNLKDPLKTIREYSDTFNGVRSLWRT